MKVSSTIRLSLLVFAVLIQFVTLIASVNNFFSLNSRHNNLKEEISKESFARTDNQDRIKRQLKEEFAKNSENEVLLKVRPDELFVLRTEEQVIQDELEEARNQNSGGALIAR